MAAAGGAAPCNSTSGKATLDKSLDSQFNQDGTRPPPGEVGARGASAPRTATRPESGIVSSRTAWWLPPPSVMAAGKTTSLAQVVPSSMKIVRTVYAEGQQQREPQRKVVRCFEDFFLFAFHLLSGLEPFLSISQSVSLGERPVVILWDRMQDLRTKDEETKADRMR